jgi:transglutaminase-like putative cysteine protease
VRLRLLHRTTFVYDGTARDSFNEARLQPSSDATQQVRSFALRIEPNPLLHAFVDYFGNAAHRFSISDPHSGLVIEAQSEVETAPDAQRSPVPGSALTDPGAQDELDLQIEYLQPSRYIVLDGELEAAARQVLPAATAVWADLKTLSGHVSRSLVYRPQATNFDTLAAEALRQRAGVCQDFAQVTIGLCRCAGIPARYVSGYFLNTSRRPGESEQEASHAWMEAWVPGRGWVGFDPTHDRPADERYVTLAVGRDYADVRPVSGTYRGLPTREMRVEVEVRAADVTAVPC